MFYKTSVKDQYVFLNYLTIGNILIYFSVNVYFIQAVKLRFLGVVLDRFSYSGNLTTHIYRF